jgi:hypothetical protein
VSVNIVPAASPVESNLYTNSVLLLSTSAVPLGVPTGSTPTKLRVATGVSFSKTRMLEMMKPFDTPVVV